MSLSDDALVFGPKYFARRGSTLSFGGSGAEMEITPRSRKALDELLRAGAIEPFSPAERRFNSEHYRVTGRHNLQALLQTRDPRNPPRSLQFFAKARGGS